MTTVADVIAATKQHLQGSHTGARLDLLASDLSALATANVVELEDDVEGIRPGTVIEIDQEQMYVRSVSPGTGAVTVMRGHADTEITAHFADTLVRIAPSYFLRDLFVAVQKEFVALNGTGLVQFHEKEFTWSRRAKMVDSDLPTTVDHLYVQEAHYEVGGSTLDDRPINVSLRTGMDTTDFPSGSAFHVHGIPSEAVTVTPTIRVVAATTFGKPTALTTVVDDGTLGMDDAIADIVSVGAAWRMILGKEAQRLNPDWSSGSRRDDAIEPGSIAFLGRALESQREELIEHALNKQMIRFPPRREVQ